MASRRVERRPSGRCVGFLAVCRWRQMMGGELYADGRGSFFGGWRGRLVCSGRQLPSLCGTSPLLYYPHIHNYHDCPPHRSNHPTPPHCNCSVLRPWSWTRTTAARPRAAVPPRRRRRPRLRRPRPRSPWWRRRPRRTLLTLAARGTWRAHLARAAPNFPTLHPPHPPPPPTPKHCSRAGAPPAGEGRRHDRTREGGGGGGG